MGHRVIAVIPGWINEKGQPKAFHQELLLKECAKYPNSKIEWVARFPFKPVTNAQRRYFHGVVVKAVHKGLRDAGYNLTVGQTYEKLKERFIFEERLNEETGEVTRLPLSMSEESNELDRMKLAQAIEEIKIWASQSLDIYIPDSGEVVPHDEQDDYNGTVKLS